MENIKKGVNISLLNLPEYILECILKRLSPIELIKICEVCTYLRDRCRSDHLWNNHIKQKWGRVIGDVAYKEWQWHITSAKEEGNNLNQHSKENGSLGSFSVVWPLLCIGSYLEDCKHLNGSLSNNFMMTLYFSLENGKFWFPAQVYRELSVSHALVCYYSETDTFEARQQNGGWLRMGNIVQWDKLRACSVEISACVRYVSDCLEDLKPGDHIEIQRRLGRHNYYDWWYAVIAHMDSCNETENDCRCRYCATLIVEFKQYCQGSSMRRIKLLRNREQCEEQAEYYGGIRKLHNEEEIERWKKLLPLHLIEDHHLQA
ncbi:F-box protein At2g32560-like [Gastrolobium bilobum]|uniref:F-box protein At2g32560-like n=1 Tax=Gastrolobium bilobum TaxID=150636 RepID=UPI002AB2A5B5|nr:F-box protein At2g32560-like [Gastrolobium bilobum]